MRTSTGTALAHRAAHRRARVTVLDQRAQPLRRHAVRGDPHLQLHLAGAGQYRRAVGVGHAEQAAAVGAAADLALRASRARCPAAAACIAMQVVAHDATPARNSQPGRDMVAAAAELARHVAQRSACRSRGSRPTCVPERQRAVGGGVVVQAHLGAALQHRLDPRSACATSSLAASIAVVIDTSELRRSPDSRRACPPRPAKPAADAGFADGWAAIPDVRPAARPTRSTCGRSGSHARRRSRTAQGLCDRQFGTGRRGPAHRPSQPPNRGDSR